MLNLAAPSFKSSIKFVLYSSKSLRPAVTGAANHRLYVATRASSSYHHRQNLKMETEHYIFGPYKIDKKEVFYSTDLSYAMVNLRPLLPVTLSGLTTSDIVAKYKGKMKAEENIPEIGKIIPKRKRVEQISGVEKQIWNEEVLENQIVSMAKLMSKEIRTLREKCDTYDMSKVEYEKDLKEAASIIRERGLEIRDKNEEILKWRSRLASVDISHEREMEAFRDDLVHETAKAVFESRIQMIEEYLAGEHVNWNLNEEKMALQRIHEEKAIDDFKDLEQAGEDTDLG